MTARAVAAGVALAVGSYALSTASVAQGFGTGPSIALEPVQSCLDTRGYGQRNWSATELARETSTCLQSLSLSQSCPSSPFSRGLAVSVRHGEPHPTWSANDRARLSDQLPQWVDDVLSQAPHIHGRTVTEARSAAAALAAAPWQLDIHVRYAGSGWSQRDLDDWVRQPRTLQVDLRLRERDTGAIKDQRELKLSFAPQLRARDADTSGARWLAQLETGIRQTSSEMLAPLACLPDVLRVTAFAGDSLRIAWGELRLRPAQQDFQVTLIPADGQLPAALWPAGRVATTTGASDGLLTLDEGEDDICLRVACVAVPR